MYGTDAIVLNMHDYGEHDMRVSFFTREFGKMQMIVRGGKKITTKQAHFLHHFGVVRIVFILGKHIPFVRSVSAISLFPDIGRTMYGYGYLYSFLLLCNTLLYDNERDESMWDLLVSSLHDVAGIVEECSASQAKEVLWNAEKQWLSRLLGIMGVGDDSIVSSFNDRPGYDIDASLQQTLQRHFNTPIHFFGLTVREHIYG